MKHWVRAMWMQLSVIFIYRRKKQNGRTETKVEAAGINLSSLTDDGRMIQTKLCFLSETVLEWDIYIYILYACTNVYDSSI